MKKKWWVKKHHYLQKYIVAVHILGQHYPADSGEPLDSQSVQFGTQVLPFVYFYFYCSTPTSFPGNHVFQADAYK